jgi:hypothetical protein
VRGRRCGDGLDLHDDGVGYDEIGRETRAQLHAVVGYGDRRLVPEQNAGCPQLMAEALLIDSFQEARACCPVDLDGEADHLFG